MATFLAGARPVEVVQPPAAKTIEVAVEVPVPDLAALDERPAPGSSDEEVVGSAAGTAQRPSIWPAVERRLLDLVRQHRSTIVFANSRRLAERLTARLNELAAEEADEAVELDAFPAEAVGQSGIGGGAPPVVAKAHHGSMSREQRTVVEEELKGGLLPCVVATSSLELGIDMGAVDLVVQVEAPSSVASGLQRVGRAGHQVGAVSRGVVFPKYRGDLVSCTVVAERMTAGAIESLRYPRNPLDVLAQHVVAMVALDPWTVGDLAAVVRRAAPFAALPDSALHAVLDMLAGRYPSEEFGELRARITWDRVTDELRGRPGAQRLAVTSGGTIPDRGLFTVTTPGGADGRGSRVGELDEEMVYESRVGDTFLLGTSSWRVEDITHDRVIVTPAPGVPARMPFWKGESIGRPLELGRAVGAFVREMSALADDDARARATVAGLDGWAVDNLLAYLREQREATRHVPSDRTILVERFRDELGDWRLVVHSPFGAQVNGPWALAIAARMRERRGVEVHASGADDGIVLRLPDAVDDGGAEVVPTAEDVLLDPAEVEQIVVAELGGSSLYASRFRECAARALLLPRRDPKRRSPLWQQRQKSAQLLAVAGKYEQFPVTLEAMRECVQDVYDLPGLRGADDRCRGAEGAGGRGGDGIAVAVRAQPAVRLRGDVPLRDRRPARRAARRRAVAGLDVAGRAAGLRGDPGAARSRGGRRGRAVAAAARPRPARPRRRGRSGPAAVPRAAVHRRGGRPWRRTGVAHRAGGGAAGDPGPHRRRGAVERDRGRRSDPRRARRTAARRRARGVHRAGAGSAGRPAAPPRPHARTVPGGRGGGPVRPGGRRGLRRAGPDGRDRPAGPW